MRELRLENRASLNKVTELSNTRAKNRTQISDYKAFSSVQLYPKVTVKLNYPRKMTPSLKEAFYVEAL